MHTKNQTRNKHTKLGLQHPPSRAQVRARVLVLLWTKLLNKYLLIKQILLLFLIICYYVTNNNATTTSSSSSTTTTTTTITAIPPLLLQQSTTTTNASLQPSSATQQTAVISTSQADVPPPKPPPPPLQTKPQDHICGGMHIRNNIRAFEVLRNCTIIDGPLTIALVSNHSNHANDSKPYEPKDYDNLSFPNLREITHYLIFFRVEGLSSLSKLFPNLAIIRGRTLVSDYSLVIYEMMHLQEINLPKLVDILRGSVRIEGNPNLCHAATVNWDRIAKYQHKPHFIMDNNKRCSLCSDKCKPWRQELATIEVKGDYKHLGTSEYRYCWNSTVSACHQTCSTCDVCSYNDDSLCCAEECAGGCYRGYDASQCVSCRFVNQDGKCKKKCDTDYYLYMDSCLTEQECMLTKNIPDIQHSQPLCPGHDDDLLTMKAYRLDSREHGFCSPSCPKGFEDDPNNRNKCKLCDKGKCRKVCNAPNLTGNKIFLISDITSLSELNGCNVIDGSLEISIKGGRNVYRELQNTFQDLEEITGFLKITRTNNLLTLGFLENLRLIKGEQLDRFEYSMLILNNPNLQELFLYNATESPSTKVLNIARGKIFVHLNPKLCPHKIQNLKTYAYVADWEEKDVSNHTNGDKEACNVNKLDVNVEKVSPFQALVRIPSYAKQMDDPRSLLSYLINYREVAKDKNITMFDGRDGCSNDLWLTIEDPVQPEKSREEKVTLLGSLQPATRYAFYVKTLTIQSQDAGALSDIVYFETAPYIPGIPKQLISKALDSNTIHLSWLPPSKPNGEIIKYQITVTKLKEMLDPEATDICSENQKSRDIITNVVTNGEQEKNHLIDETNSTSFNEPSSLNSCDSKKTQNTIDHETKTEVVHFQDTIIHTIYLNRQQQQQQHEQCQNNTDRKPTRKKRAISSSLFPPNSAFLTSMNHIVKEPIAEFTGNERRQNQTEAIPQYDFKMLSNRNNGTHLTIEVKNSDKKDKKHAYIIKNLHHYTQYSIEVVACQKNHTSTKQMRLSKDYHPCSLQALSYIRTLPKKDVDKVREIKFYAANETNPDNMIKWEKPSDTNGPTYGYEISTKSVSGSPHFWQTVCINSSKYDSDNSFMLRFIPGHYQLKVKALTLHSVTNRGESNDEIIEFTIANQSLVTPFTISIATIFCIVLLITLGYTTCYFQKHKTAANGLLYASVNPDYIQYEADEWEVEKDNLIVGASIGTGSFGQVFKGELITEKGKLECAIKTVPTNATAKHRMDFLREASTMKQFDTHHIVKLLGVVSVSTPVYVIMEYMSNGDLKSYLRRERNKYESKNCLVEGIHLMAAQIADGMAYLAVRKYVHRDLAARNCLVATDRTVKIGDFGLTRDVYASEYYRRGTEARLPVRWMSPEALKDNIYTTASDVWSFGIVLWEMVTFSAYPYQGLSNDEVVARVSAGHTLSRPENCTDSLFRIMQSCWRKNLSERQSFIELVEILLSETDKKLSPDSFYRKQKTEPNSIAQGSPGDGSNQTTGTESYPLLSWPSTRAPGVLLNLEPQE